MAKDVTLTDINGEKIYPKTYMKNVYDSSGQKTLEDKMATIDTDQIFTGSKTLNAPLIVTGGDASSGVGNIQLDTDGNIIAKGTNSTLLGLSGGNLLAGHSSYPLLLRGKNTRPTYNGANMATVTDVNNISMCPAGGKYIQVSIKSYTTVNDVVFTAPDNGYATIRGNFSGSWAYCIKDGGGSFYQWASASGSPFFPLRKGAQILINYVTGTMTWADLYFVSAKQI